MELEKIEEKREHAEEMKSYFGYIYRGYEEQLEASRELEALNEQLLVTNDRLRSSSKAGLVNDVAALQTQLQQQQEELRVFKARRTKNQRRVSDCNLAISRAEKSVKEKKAVQDRCNSFWEGGLDPDEAVRMRSR